MTKIKDKIASGLGSVLEWYDFALYGFFSPIIAQLYFPSSEPFVGLLKTFSVFAIGFIARPIGALLFGYISDKYGRAKSLKLTPLLITLPTLLLSILPSYQEIGMLAPFILIWLRIWQGICIGGEFSNNIIYLCESSKSKKNYFLGSIGSCTGSFGIFLASSVATICYKVFSPSALLSYGWRIAFAFSLILGIITYFMRQDMKETPVFKEIIKTKRVLSNPLSDSYKFQLNDYVISFGLTFFPATAFYYVFMFLPNFLNNILKVEAGNVLSDNAISLFFRILIIPFLGLAADKFGGVRMMRLSCILFLLLSYPLLYGIVFFQDYLFVFIYIFSFLTTLNAATTTGLLMELLKPETRSTIFSFTFNLSFGIFGGIVPIISFLITDIFSSKMASAYYLMFSAIVTLVASFFFKKSKAHDYKKLFANLN